MRGCQMPFTSNLDPLLTVFPSLFSFLFSLSSPILLPRSLLLGLTLSPCLFDLSSVPLILFLNRIQMLSTLTSLRPWNKVKFPCHLMNDNSRLSCQVPKRSCFYIDLQITTHLVPQLVCPLVPKARVNPALLSTSPGTYCPGHCGCAWCLTSGHSSVITAKLQCDVAGAPGPFILSLFK